MTELTAKVFHLRNCAITVYRSKRDRKGPRYAPGQLRHCLVSGPSVVGGILPLVYLLPLRPSDPENPERIRRLPRELLRTIGAPVPRKAFAGGRLPPGGIRIWQVRSPGS